MSESYHDFITKTLGIELETWQHRLIKEHAERYSQDIIESPKLSAADRELARGNWYVDYGPVDFMDATPKGDTLAFSIIDEMLEYKRRWLEPTDEERAADLRRDKERDERILAIIEGREDRLYAPQPPSKPLWEEPRAPLNRAERRVAARKNGKKV